VKRDHGELTESLRLAGVAIVSAAVVAAVVIALGEGALHRPTGESQDREPGAALIRTSS